MREKMQESFYIPDLSEQELHAFNVLFRELVYDKDISQRTARKILSGVRSKASTNAKINKYTAQVWLRRWHSRGLVTRIHGSVRLGSPGRYSSVLDERNRELVRRNFE